MNSTYQSPLTCHLPLAAGPATGHWPLTTPFPARFRSGSFSLSPRFSAVPAGNGMDQPFQRLFPSFNLSRVVRVCAPQTWCQTVPKQADSCQIAPMSSFSL
jgi:hypothetical protein